MNSDDVFYKENPVVYIMAKKPEILYETRVIEYSEKQWSHLWKLRDLAIPIMQKLKAASVNCLAYGSLARGDVSKSSDIDIIIPYVIPSYKIEVVLGQGVRRELVQATPSSVLKGHLCLDNEVVISFPLFKMMSREQEFYRWGGQVTPQQIIERIRVLGVDKRLILIEPTETGHIEYGVIGNEYLIAKKIGVSVTIAQERVRVLTRRDKVGRTGVYLTRVLSEYQNFESVARSLMDRDPALRRTVYQREK